MKPAFLYHGTPALVTHLEPRPARGRRSAKDRLRAVYASHERPYAMAFALPMTPDEGGEIAWSLDYADHVPRIVIHAGALDMGRVGYLYRVRANRFVPLDELQWVSHTRVVPHDYEVIHPTNWVHWIASHPETRTRRKRDTPRTRPQGRGIDFDRLRRHVTAQFRLPPHSVHGPDHWRRVGRNGLLLATRTGADIAVVRLFALLHDCRRENDASDNGHGARAAEFAASLRGVLFDLPDETFELLRFACAWHTDRLHHQHPTIGTCWDADRLDLGRVGVIPDPQYMSTAFGREIARDGFMRPFLNDPTTLNGGATSWLRGYGAC